MPTGSTSTNGFLVVVDARMHASIGSIETQAAAGDEAFARLISDGHLDRMRSDADWLAANVPERAVELGAAVT